MQVTESTNALWYIDHKGKKWRRLVAKVQRQAAFAVKFYVTSSEEEEIKPDYLCPLDPVSYLSIGKQRNHVQLMENERNRQQKSASGINKGIGTGLGNSSNSNLVSKPGRVGSKSSNSNLVSNPVSNLVSNPVSNLASNPVSNVVSKVGSNPASNFVGNQVSNLGSNPVRNYASNSLHN